jgi:acyl carrier protein
MNKGALLDIINRKIKEISEEFDFGLNSQESLIYVYSEEGTFDSMMLVALLAEIEEELLVNNDIDISLTSDKAMAKNTPFESNLSILSLILDLI